MATRKPARVTAWASMILWLTWGTTGAFAHPGSGIAVDANGRVFFTDTGKGIWRINDDGDLTLISKSAMHWMAIDQEGKFADSPDEFGEWFGRLTPQGQKPTLISCSDFPCVVGKDGNLYFAKMHGLTIMRRTPQGQESVLVSREDFGVAADRPVGVNGMACGPDGTLYLVSLDSLNKHEGSGEHVLYAIGLDGAIRTVAKNFVRDLLPESERHPEVRPQYCRGMAVDEQGTVFVAVTGNRCIMKFTPQGATSVVLKAPKPWTPTGVAVSQGNVYVLEYDDETPTQGRNWPPRIRRLGKDGKVVAIAAVRGSGSAPTSENPHKLVLQTPPATSLNSVTVSPDGSLVATAAGEGGVRLYNAKTGTLLRTLGDAGDRGVVFSPDSRRLTAAGFHMDKLVGVYDVQLGKRVLALPGQTEWEAYATALSPDGKLLASTATDKQILVWELATGKLRHQFQNQPEKIAVLAFSPDSAALASGGGDKLIHLWDMASGKLKRSLSGHSDWICTLAYSPDGNSIASGSCDWGFHRGHDWPRGARGAEKCEWRLWNADSGKLLRSEQQSGQLLSLAFAPIGKSLVVSVDNNLLHYDLSSETAGRVITSHHATITSAAFTPDGAAIITGSHDQTAKRTNLTTGKTEWEAPGYFEQVNSVALSADGSHLVTGSSDHRFARGRLPADASELGPGALRLWDARTGRLLRQFGRSPHQIMAVAISPDGKRIASGGASATGKGIAHVRDSATGSLVWSNGESENEVLALAFSPDGKMLAAGTADGSVRICDANSGTAIQTLTGHEGGATSLAFSPDGKVIFCGGAPGSARAWNVATGQLMHTCKSAASKVELFTIDRRMNSIGLSRDGTTLATCGSSVNNEFVGSVKIWDTRSGELARDFAPENIHGRPMALSPDGSIIATGGKSIRLWEVHTGKMLRELYGHLKRTQSIVFSADGRLIFAGGSYGTTNLWEVATGKHLVTLFAFPNGQPAATTDDWLAYTPDGKYDGSAGAERFLAWRTADEFHTADRPSTQPNRPTRVTSALQLKASR